MDQRPVRSRQTQATLWRIMGFVRPHKIQVAMWLVAMISSSVIAVIPNWILRILLDQALPGREYRLWGELAALVLCARILYVGTKAFQARMGGWVTTRITADIRRTMSKKLATMAPELVGRFQPATLTARIVDGASHLDTFLSTALQAIGQGVLMVFVAILLFALDAKLALLAVLAIVPSVLSSMLVFRMTRKWWRKSWRAGMHLRLDVAEYVQHTRIHQFFLGPSAVSLRLSDRVSEAFVAARLAATKGPVYTAIVTGVATSMIPILWFIAVLQVMGGETRLSVIVVFMAYVAQLYTPINSLGVSLQQAAGSLVSGMDLFALHDLLESASREESEHKQLSSYGRQALDQSRIAVKAEGLSYSYLPNRALLHGVSFEVHQGEWAAIVGETGVGKTTLGHLVAGLLTPQAGTIRIYGYNMGDVDGYNRPFLVGYVPQEAGLIQGTVAENIALGLPDSTPTAIVWAAKIAQAHDFIVDLPDAYDSQLGMDGAGLSGGQRQRIAIARALVRCPKLLVLDEASAGLDYETESRLLGNLRAELPSTAVILITHRLTTIANASQVLVMRHGTIQESGSYDDLIRSDGLLSELVASAAVAT